MSAAAPGLRTLLVRHRNSLLRFVGAEARGLLRYESAEDLVQGVHLRALERGGRFEYRGREPFYAWLYTVARSFLTDRRAHWSALKRRSGRLLRYTQGVAETSDPLAVPEPAGAQTGPSTFAARREQIVLVVRTLDLLLPRDRDLVRWSGEELSNAEIAQNLGISHAAAARARLRALERFRDAFDLVSRAS